MPSFLGKSCSARDKAILMQLSGAFSHGFRKA